MIIGLILVVLGGLLIGLAAEVLIVLIKTSYSFKSFKKKTDLPLVPGFNPLLGHAIVFEARNWKQVDEYHRTYGNTWAWMFGAKPAVCTTDLDLIKTFTLDEPEQHVNRVKLNFPANEIEYDCIMFAEGDQWRRIRRAFAPALTSHKIKAPNVQSEIKAVIDKLVQALDDKLSGAEDRGESFVVQDVDEILSRYSMDLVFRCFYKQPNLIEYTAKTNTYVETVDRGLRMMLNPFAKLAMTFPTTRSVMDWLTLHFNKLGKMRKDVRRFIVEETRQNLLARREMEATKRQEKSGHFDADNFVLSDGSKFKRNLIDHIIDQFHDGKISSSEYYNSAFFLFLASNKTSADALVSVLYCLATNQQVQDKLRHCVMREGPDAEYLGWVINESMRLIPPVLIGCSRTVTRDIKTASGLIPSGTLVITPVYTIHRLAEYWGADANEFRPERWANAKSFHPAQFLAFGLGKRNCPGGIFALHEMRKLLDALLRRFRFERSDETVDNRLFQSPLFIFTYYDSPCYLRISRL